jgi:6-pyruvoyltetrahydropterin/6-carboxytetrahydropterin synthase
MYTIRKIFKMEMAHQLFDAYSAACKNCLHGHSYICEIYLKGPQLDETEMLMDFSKVKDKIKDYMDSWDHALVMPTTFPKEYLDILKKYNTKLMLVDYNPTAERMAKEIYFYIKKLLPSLSKVRLHETTTGWAEFVL